jgi:hypothetical protein
MQRENDPNVGEGVSTQNWPASGGFVAKSDCVRSSDCCASAGTRALPLPREGVIGVLVDRDQRIVLQRSADVAGPRVARRRASRYGGSGADVLCSPWIVETDAVLSDRGIAVSAGGLK